GQRLRTRAAAVRRRLHDGSQDSGLVLWAWGYRRDFERRLFGRCNRSSLTISCSLALRMGVSPAPSGASNRPTCAAILRVASAAFSLPFSALSTCFSTIPSSLLIDRFRAPSRRTTGAVRAPWMMVLRFRLFRGRPRGFPDWPACKREAIGG